MKFNLEELKASFIKIKDYFKEMSKEKRKKILIIAGIVVAVATVLTVVLNVNRLGYRVLYTGLEAQEATSIYEALQEMGASPQLNSGGNVMVQSKDYDRWLLQLAAKGYPRSTMTYDVFASHSGLTTTESEKKQWLLYQLQDRIQETVKRIDGVDNVTITITMPDDDGYVWQNDGAQIRSTAGILLTLRPGKFLSTEQVSAIKTLVSSSVPKMTPEDVTVVDALTMLELSADQTQAVTPSSNLEFEQMVQRQIENNILRLLTPRYGKDGVVAVAKVTINYDKMITESMELLEKEKGNGETGGYPTHTDGQYNINGNEDVGGIVGEENNTDIPQMGYNDPNGEGGITSYNWNNDFDYGYIKKQIEKGNAVLDRATVSVMVNEPDMDNRLRNDLINLISKSADIDTELISVSQINSQTKKLPSNIFEFLQSVPLWVYIVLGLILVIILIFIFIGSLSSKKYKKERAKLDDQKKKYQIEEDERKFKVEKEISDYKKQLSELANSGMDPKDFAIVREVREFAKDSPEITASLIRSWLKDGE